MTQAMDPFTIWFAWYPVALSRFDGQHWQPTGESAWWRNVRVVKTIWGETFYLELEYA